MTTAEVLKEIAKLPVGVANSFALIVIGCPIGVVLGKIIFDSGRNFEQDAPFLATCVILSTVVYCASNRLRWMIDCFGEYLERK